MNQCTLHYNSPAAVRNTTDIGQAWTFNRGSLDNTSGAAITSSTYNPLMKWTANVTFIGSNGDGPLNVGDFIVDGTLSFGIVDVEQEPESSLVVAGNLDVTGASLSLNITAGTVQTEYIIATYGSLTGTFSSITGLPAGWAVDYSHNTTNAIAIVPPAPVAPPARPAGLTATAAAWTTPRWPGCVCSISPRARSRWPMAKKPISTRDMPSSWTSPACSAGPGSTPAGVRSCKMMPTASHMARAPMTCCCAFPGMSARTSAHCSTSGESIRRTRRHSAARSRQKTSLPLPRSVICSCITRHWCPPTTRLSAVCPRMVGQTAEHQRLLGGTRAFSPVGHNPTLRRGRPTAKRDHKSRRDPQRELRQ